MHNGGGAILWLMAGVVLFALFTIILSVKLDSPDSSMSWYGVFVPYWVGLMFFLLVDESWPEYRHKFHTYNFEDTHSIRYASYERYLDVFPKQFLIAFAIFGILHTLHLESDVNISWTLRFLPFFIVTGLYILYAFANMLSPKSSMFLDVTLPLLLATPFVAFEVTLFLYLRGSISSFAVANVPLFVADVILWFGSCIFSCFLS